MIWCCMGCTRKIKSAYCHGYCDAYIAQSEAHKAEQAAIGKKRYTEQNLYAQRDTAVGRAKRRSARQQKWFADGGKK